MFVMVNIASLGISCIVTFTVLHYRDNTMGSERQRLPHDQYVKTRNEKLNTTRLQRISYLMYIIYLKSMYFCTKCYTCDVGSHLAVKPVLLTNIYHVQNIESQTSLLRKSEESFDTAIVKKLRKFQLWEKKLSYKVKNVYGSA